MWPRVHRRTRSRPHPLAIQTQHDVVGECPFCACRRACVPACVRLLAFRVCIAVEFIEVINKFDLFVGKKRQQKQRKAKKRHVTVFGTDIFSEWHGVHLGWWWQLGVCVHVTSSFAFPLGVFIKKAFKISRI